MKIQSLDELHRLMTSGSDMAFDLTFNATGEVVGIDEDAAVLVKHAIGHDGEQWEFRDVPGYPGQRALWTRMQGRSWTQTVVVDYGTDDEILTKHAHQIADWYGFSIGEIAE